MRGEHGSRRRFGLRRVVVVLALTLLGALVFGSLAEHFGWRLFREAGGQIVRAASWGDSRVVDTRKMAGDRNAPTQAGVFVLS